MGIYKVEFQPLVPVKDKPYPKCYYVSLMGLYVIESWFRKETAEDHVKWLNFLHRCKF